jgi:hypothetical protein
MSYNLTGAAQGGNSVFVSAGLTGLSGAATTYSTGATSIQYSVNGKMPTAKAQVSGGASPTTDANSGVAFPAMAINKAAVFVWGLNAAGTVLVAQGPVVAWTDTTASSTVCPFPSIPDTMTPFAYHTIQNGAAGSAWTFGASNWNATGITLPVVTNVSELPPTPPLTV